MHLALLFSLLLVFLCSFISFHWIQGPLRHRVGVSLLGLGRVPPPSPYKYLFRCSFLRICDRAEIYSLQTKQSLQDHFFKRDCRTFLSRILTIKRKFYTLSHDIFNFSKFNQKVVIFYEKPYFSIFSKNIDFFYQKLRHRA